VEPEARNRTPVFEAPSDYADLERRAGHAFRPMGLFVDVDLT
jgi:hypothetical protein